MSRMVCHGTADILAISYYLLRGGTMHAFFRESGDVDILATLKHPHNFSNFAYQNSA